MEEKIIYLVQEQVIDNATKASHTFMRGCFDDMDFANKRIAEINQKHADENENYASKERTFGVVGKDLTSTYFIYVMEMPLNK